MTSVLREPKAETFVTLSGFRTIVPRRGVIINYGKKMIQKWLFNSNITSK
jgi:hypothetical protein